MYYIRFQCIIIFLFSIILVSCQKSTGIGNELNTEILSDPSSETLTLSQGLIAYYPLNGNASDISGNNLNGTTFNVTPTSDRKKRKNAAFYFPGFRNQNGSSIILPPDSKLDLLGNFSISLWVYPMEWTNSNYIDGLVSFIGINDSYSFCVKKETSQSTNFSLGLESRFSNSIIETSGQNGLIELNKWNHCIITYDKVNGILRLYKNTKLIKQQNNLQLELPDTNRETLLGAGGLYGYFFTGKIDDVRLYSRVLTTKEVSALYKY